MTTLVAGANGATGKQLVEQLLQMGQRVKIIVRPLSTISNAWNEKVTIIRANISEMSANVLAEHTKDCQAIVSCLGHNLTLKGIFGKPRKLVTNAVKLLCNAVEKNSSEDLVKFVLMNTTGNRNKDLDEPVSFLERIIMSIIRLLVPPQSDNEKVADFLRLNIGQNAKIQWVIVRPDSLINEDSVTEYKLYPSPARSVLFNSGKTSRINVGNFMARLIVENDLWEEWKGKMPVIYNEENKG
jgi:putative NADH-flavin reductase